ncbi:MAG TPA: S8 family serine peptidase [Fimbriimonadaceae bacterium]|nr:S8 family serine peptidase [Fimbriimonadaceae bacterium]HRJ96623.1 S8 family serine peptidase [Fimbriimonadaceae bacterium]
MRSRTSAAPTLLLWCFGLFALSPLASADFPTYAPGVVLVEFAPEASPRDRARLVASLGFELDPRVDSPYFARLVSPTLVDIGEAVARLRASHLVRIAEPDWIGHVLETIPNDPRFPEMWGLRNTGQSGGLAGADIHATGAWDIQRGNPQLKVAVIDTGVSYNHVDLSPNIWVNPGEIPNNGIDDDGNGRIDDIHGYDFVNNDGNPADDHGHGTHCSGTIGAAGNNGIGVTGICWNVTLIAIKAFNASGQGLITNAVLAIDYARQNGARIMSNSYAFNVQSAILLEAIRRAQNAGIVFVAGAGNNGQNSDLTPLFPAGFSPLLDNVIAVGASDRNDNKAGFSNYGAKSVDLFAPGVDILSTYPVNFYLLGSGTSMATPHVAGAAALLVSQFPSESPIQIRERIRAQADRIPSLAGLSIAGRLNIDRSIRALRVEVRGTVELLDWEGNPTDETVTITFLSNEQSVEQWSGVPLGPSGEFVVDTSLSGPHEVVVQGQHWLAQRWPAPVVLGVANVSNLSFELTNGDCNGDNEVDIGDYSLVSIAFGTAPGEPGWDARADLSGDEVVDIGDFAILSMNFGRVGD